ncbi:MAG: cyclic nucleotide-binding domain-containing protein [Myxococcota bacterium]
MDAKLRQTITESPLFKHLEEERRDALVETSRVVKLDKGSTVIEEGSRVDSLYIVVEGRVRVWTHTGDRDVELKNLGPGAYFGEVSLLSGKEATANVEVRSDTATFIAVERERVLDLVKTDERVRKMLEGVTLARAKDTIGKVLK